jgi:hypothetical protein
MSSAHCNSISTILVSVTSLNNEEPHHARSFCCYAVCLSVSNPVTASRIGMPTQYVAIQSRHCAATLDYHRCLMANAETVLYAGHKLLLSNPSYSPTMIVFPSPLHTNATSCFQLALTYEAVSLMTSINCGVERN